LEDRAMDDGRDRRGRFALGNRGGPGRPKRATEAEYLRALSRIVTVEDLRAIARRAVADAKRGSARAREWVSKYLLGNPIPREAASAGCQKRLARALLQAVLETISEEQAAPRPTGEGRPPEDQATGGAEAPAGQGLTTPSPSEGHT
jgi:hypothetical protein